MIEAIVARLSRLFRRSFRSRWFPKAVSPIGTWSENGYFGTSGDKMLETFEKIIRESGTRPEYHVISQEKYAPALWLRGIFAADVMELSRNSFATPARISPRRFAGSTEGRVASEPLFSGVVSHARFSFTWKRPTFSDRLWFAWDHRRGCPMMVLWAIVRGRATGIHLSTATGDGTIYLNHGYAATR